MQFAEPRQAMRSCRASSQRSHVEERRLREEQRWLEIARGFAACKTNTQAETLSMGHAIGKHVALIDAQASSRRFKRRLPAALLQPLLSEASRLAATPRDSKALRLDLPPVHAEVLSTLLCQWCQDEGGRLSDDVFEQVAGPVVIADRVGDALLSDRLLTIEDLAKDLGPVPPRYAACFTKWSESVDAEAQMWQPAIVNLCNCLTAYAERALSVEAAPGSRSQTTKQAHRTLAAHRASSVPSWLNPGDLQKKLTSKTIIRHKDELTKLKKLVSCTLRAAASAESSKTKTVLTNMQDKAAIR